MKDRLLNIDVLRVIAVIFVLIVHLLSNTNFWMFSYSGIVNQTNFVFFSVFLISLLETAIPLFLVVSGYCNAKKVSFEKNRLIKNVIRIYIPYIICCGIYLLTNCIVHDFSSLREYIILAISFDLPYMWYLGAYLLLLLLMPFLNKVFVNLKQSEQKFILIVLFIFIIIPETVNAYGGKIICDYYIQGLDFIFYYFIGCYLHDLEYSTKNLYILNFVTGIIFFVYYLTLPLTQNLVVSRNHFVIFMLTITLFVDAFILFKNCKRNTVVSLFAQKSLLIYMLSWNFERLFYHYFGVELFSLNFIRCFIFICVELLTVFSFSLLLDFILKKLEDKICMII